MNLRKWRLARRLVSYRSDLQKGQKLLQKATEFGFSNNFLRANSSLKTGGGTFDIAFWPKALINNNLTYFHICHID
jgi:hypothetical protein